MRGFHWEGKKQFNLGIPVVVLVPIPFGRAARRIREKRSRRKNPWFILRGLFPLCFDFYRPAIVRDPRSGSVPNTNVYNEFYALEPARERIVWSGTAREVRNEADDRLPMDFVTAARERSAFCGEDARPLAVKTNGVVYWKSCQSLPTKLTGRKSFCPTPFLVLSVFFFFFVKPIDYFSNRNPITIRWFINNLDYSRKYV